MKSLNYQKLILIFGFSLCIAILSLFIKNVPMLAGALGISATASETVVNLIGAYSTISFVITIIGVVTGIGAISSGIAATILYLIKSKGKAAAAIW